MKIKNIKSKEKKKEKGNFKKLKTLDEKIEYLAKVLGLK